MKKILVCSTVAPTSLTLLLVCGCLNFMAPAVLHLRCDIVPSRVGHSLSTISPRVLVFLHTAYPRHVKNRQLCQREQATCWRLYSCLSLCCWRTTYAIPVPLQHYAFARAIMPSALVVVTYGWCGIFVAVNWVLDGQGGPACVRVVKEASCLLFVLHLLP